jgi:hypothetical protein
MTQGPRIHANLASNFQTCAGVLFLASKNIPPRATAGDEIGLEVRG